MSHSPEIIIFGHEKKTFAGYNSIRLPLYSDPRFLCSLKLTLPHCREMLFQQTLTWIVSAASKALPLPFRGKSQTESFFTGRKKKEKNKSAYTSLLILIHASVTGKACGREYELLVFVTFGKIPRIKKKKKEIQK